MKKSFAVILCMALFCTACKKASGPATVICTTYSASNISETSATLNGVAVIENAEEALARTYFFYSSEASDSSGLRKNGKSIQAGDIDNTGGTFKARISGLKENTKYYFIAVTAIDNVENAGAVKTFTTSKQPEIKVTGITLDKSSVSVTSSKSVILKASVLPENATDKQVIWSSEDESIFRIDQEGNILGCQPGTANAIALTHDGNKRASCKVTVNPAKISYVDLGLSVMWADCNLGAGSMLENGDYYAWGDIETYYIGYGYKWDSPKWKTGKSTGYSWQSYKFRTYGDSNEDVEFYKYNDDPDRGSIDYKTVLESTDDIATVVLGGDWRIPTIEEWGELIRECNWLWSYYNGVYGFWVTGRKEGFWSNRIFLPAAGCHNGEGMAVDMGKYGHYWSSSLREGYQCYSANGITFHSKTTVKELKDFAARFEGRSVRPVYIGE